MTELEKPGSSSNATKAATISPDDPNFDYKTLKCKNCYEYLEPPIRLCGNQHDICDKCYELNNKCKKCKTKLDKQSIARNVYLEEFINETELACPFSKHGCDFKCKLKNLQMHEDDCSFQTIPCPLFSIIKCEWKAVGLEIINSVFEHVLQTHSDFKHNLNDPIDITNLNMNKPLVRIFTFDEKTFVVLLKLNFLSEPPGFRWNVYRFYKPRKNNSNEPSEGKKYLCKITLKHPNENKNLVLKAKCERVYWGFDLYVTNASRFNSLFLLEFVKNDKVVCMVDFENIRR